MEGATCRAVSHDPTFRVYQAEDGSFKIGSTDFKYKNTHVFVDNKSYRATPGHWELLTLARPDRNMVTEADIQAYQQIFTQSNAHKVN
jgi:hypothetical protein